MSEGAKQHVEALATRLATIESRVMGEINDEALVTSLSNMVVMIKMNQEF